LHGVFHFGRIYVCMCVYAIYTHTHTHTHLAWGIPLWAHIRLYVCVYIAYTHTHTHTKNTHTLKNNADRLIDAIAQACCGSGGVRKRLWTHTRQENKTKNALLHETHKSRMTSTQMLCMCFIKEHCTSRTQDVVFVLCVLSKQHLIRSFAPPQSSGHEKARKPNDHDAAAGQREPRDFLPSYLPHALPVPRA